MYNHKNLEEKVFDGTYGEVVLEVLRFQYENNQIYRAYVDALGKNVANIHTADAIPFLPIRFFKTQRVITTQFDAEVVFESSGTTETTNSKHFIKDKSIYERSFLNGFRQFYGDVKDWCILGLLPSYLERSHSSLVYMVQQLIEKSNHPKSGFYLYDFGQLASVIRQLEADKQR